MRRNAWAPGDNTWRQGLLQRLEDINSELERQAPVVLARQAERNEHPSAYQIKCQEILDRLRQDCATINTSAATDAGGGTVPPPEPAPATSTTTAAAPELSTPPALPSRFPPSLASNSTGPAWHAVAPGNVSGGEAFALGTDLAVPDGDTEDSSIITNESILAYANSSGLIADHMANRLKVGLWVVMASCGVAVATVSALFVATVMDASQSTSTVHALPASVAAGLANEAGSKRQSGSDRPGALDNNPSPSVSSQGWIRASFTPLAMRDGAIEPAIRRETQVQSPPQKPPRPSLIADMFVRREDAHAIPMSLRLDGGGRGDDYARHTILVRDLPEGATMNAGAKVGPRTWSLSPQAMEGAKLHLTSETLDPVDIRIELVDPIGEPVTRTRLRIRLMPHANPPVPQVSASLDADRRKLDVLAKQAAAASTVTKSTTAEPQRTTQPPAAKPAKAEAEPTKQAPPAKLSPAAVAADNKSDDDDEVPKPKSKRQQSAKLPAPPSALGAKPSAPQRAAPPATASTSPKKWIGQAPAWSPFNNQPVGRQLKPCLQSALLQ